MPLWFKNYSLEEINGRGKKTMVEYLDIRFIAIDAESLTATMPVDHRTVQPLKLLHGGASVALAETIGSTAANLALDPEKRYAVGIEINANHIRSASRGRVTGVGKPLHLGGSTQVWEIRMTDETQKLISVSRLTMAVLERGK